MDLIRELNELAFLSRLRRLVELLSKDASRIYSSQNVDFEARWFPLTYLLKDHSPMAVTDVAKALGTTHPAVNQVAEAMSRRGLLSSEKDSNDERRRLLSLTSEGRETVLRLQPIWQEIFDATREVIDSADADIMGAINRIEDELNRRSIYERVVERLKKRRYESVEVVDYTPKYKRFFKTLNYEWLQRHFEVEPLDEVILSDPNDKILKKGGHVFFARIDGEIIGTCALLKHDKDTFELTKMAVTQSAQGKQAGRRLGEAAIDWAKSHGAHSVVLQTSSELEAANNLYRSFGFVKVNTDDAVRSKYMRTSIWMVLDLNNRGREVGK